MSVHELNALFYSGIFCLTTAFALSKLSPIFKWHILNEKAKKEVSTFNEITVLCCWMYNFVGSDAKKFYICQSNHQ
jgi:hypothetical protein